MPYLFEALLFAAPFALYALWRLFNPGVEPSGRLLGLAALGVGLMLAGAVAYGLERSLAPGGIYIPPHTGADGRIEAGHTGPRR
jgi:hypothetical protein